MEKIADSDNKNLIYYLCLVLFFVTNMIVSGSFDLIYDEAYYWMYSRHLDFGFFDHPPMVGLLIKLGTAILGDTVLGVRLFFNLLLVLSVHIMWKTIDNKSSVVFWCMVLMFPLVNLGGILALPDLPILFFTSLFFYFLKRYINEDTMKNAIGLGIIIPMLFYSKYHAILIVLLSVMAYPKFCLRKSFWIIVLMSILLFLPHMWWQYKNDWVTFNFHLFKRAQKNFDINNILNFLSGQIALLGMLNFFIFTYIFIKKKSKNVFERILKFNSYGFLLFLLFLSFRNQIEANWSVTVSVVFILLFTSYINDVKKPSFYFLSTLPILLILGMKLSLINLDFVLSKMSQKESRINEVYGWPERIKQINSICGDQRIVGDNYQISSKVGFYNQRDIPSLHLGSRDSQYGLWNFEKAIPAEEKICYLTSKNLDGAYKVETNYKDPVYIIKDISLNDLAKRYNTTYEKIIRE